MAKKFRLRILTPDDIKIDEDVETVIIRCTTGAMGIMAGHEPRSAVLDYGVVRIISDGTEYGMAVFGGIAEMKDNVLTILTGEAQFPEDIDILSVEAARKDAEHRLQGKMNTLEIQKQQVNLRRSLVMLEVSSYPNLTVHIEGEEEDSHPNVTI